MRGKSVALLAVALGCGLVASLGISQLMSRRDAEPDSTGDTQNVVVAVKDFVTAEALTAQSIKLVPWPTKQLPPGALTRLEDADGRRVKFRLCAGVPILETQLVGNGRDEPGIDETIGAGMRVVSVKVDAVSSLGGLLMPGSHVDLQVYLRRNAEMGILETSTITLLQNVKVFAVNDVVNMESVAKDGKSIDARTVSLLVTPAQAEQVTLAGELGSIRLIMRSPKEDAKVDSKGSTASQVFGGQPADDKSKGLADFLKSMRGNLTGAAPAAPPTAPAAPPAVTLPTVEVPAPPATWSMRVLKGAEINDVEMEKAEAASRTQASELWKVSGLKSGPPVSKAAPAAPPQTTKPVTENVSSLGSHRIVIPGSRVQIETQ
ncbi:MAG: Flp pilus assembly protein CpaB [Thermoguttaceae bacterium]|jgi:pilus assembly protein CpaB